MPGTGSADHYRVLGIPATSKPSEIKAAFRRLAIRYHPVALALSPVLHIAQTCFRAHPTSMMSPTL